MVAIISGEAAGLSLRQHVPDSVSGLGGQAQFGRTDAGVSVNVSTGNLVLSQLDLQRAGPGPDTRIQRIYNSQGEFAGAADHWLTGPVARRVALEGALLTAGSRLRRSDEDGATAVYVFDAASAAYLSPAGAGAQDRIEVEAAAAQLLWIDGDSGMQERYQATGEGHILEQADALGNCLRFDWNAQGLLAGITDAAGQYTVLEYEGVVLTGLRTVEPDGAVTRVRYSHDSLLRLSGVDVDIAPGRGSGASMSTRYVYEGDSKRLASVQCGDGSRQDFSWIQGDDGRVRLAAVTNALGETTRFDYDLAARRTRVTDALGARTEYELDVSGQVTRITGPSGVVQRLFWSAQGDLVRLDASDGSVLELAWDARGNECLRRDGTGSILVQDFDDNNHRIAATRFQASGVWARQSLEELAGLPAAARVGIAPDHRWVFDARTGLQRFEVSAAGRVTETRYNSWGQAISVLQYAGLFADPGLRLDLHTLEVWAGRQDAARLARTDFAYDQRGELSRGTRYARVDVTGQGLAEGAAVRRFIRDQAGRVLQEMDADAGVTLYTYDGLGRLLTSTDALGQQRQTVYDDAGNRISVAQASGLRTSSVFDRAGRLISALEAGGETRYAYDAAGRLGWRSEPLGARHWWIHDAAGRVIAEIDADGSATEFVFNAAGLLTRTIDYATAVPPGLLADAPISSDKWPTLRPRVSVNDRSSWCCYDAAQRLVKTIAADGAVLELRYDAASRVVARVAAKNVVDVSLLGDAPEAAAVQPPASAEDRITRYFFDPDGLLCATLDASGALIEQRFDSFGRLVARIAYARLVPPGLRTGADLAALRPSASDADAVSWYGYDGQGRVVLELDPEGLFTERSLDGAGHTLREVAYATRVLIPPDGDPGTLAALRPQASAGDQVRVFSYDALGRLILSIDAQGWREQRWYDAGGNLVRTSRGAGSADERVHMARFDQQGHVSAELSAEGSSLLLAHPEQAEAIWASHAVTHTWDLAGQRISTRDAMGNTTWYYHDADGRTTQVVNALGEVEERRYNALNQLIQTSRLANRLDATGLRGGLADAAFLAAVEAVRDNSLDRRVSNTYTRAGRIAGVIDARGALTSHRYDSFGDRVTTSQSLGGGATQVRSLRYDALGRLLEEVLDPAGLALTKRQDYDAFGRLVRSVDPSGQLSTRTYDRLGRMVTLVDAPGALSVTAYDVFGRVLTQTDALGRVTVYRHDAARHALTVTTPEGVRVHTVLNAHGQVQQVSNGRGDVTRYRYDHDGHLLSTETPGTTSSAAYDRAGRLVSSTDANGVITTLAYDAAARILTRTVDPDGLAIVTRSAWDAFGQLTGSTDANGVTTRYSYDSSGQMVRRVLDPGGLALTTAWSYDARGKVLAIVDANGVLTRHVYDIAGRRVSSTLDPAGLSLQTRYQYDARDNLVASIDANGAMSRFVFDQPNRPVFSIDALGGVTEQVFDAAGQVVRVIRYARVIDLTGLGPLADPNSVRARLAAVSGPGDSIERRLYDADGRLRYTIDAEGGVVGFVFDANGQVIERRAYAQAVSTESDAPFEPPPASAADEVTRTFYDADQRVAFIVDGAGGVRGWQRDGAGRVVEETAWARPLPAAALRDLASLSAALASLSDPQRDRQVRSAYDAAGRLVASVDGTAAVTSCVYDANGNLLRMIKRATPLAADPSGRNWKTAWRTAWSTASSPSWSTAISASADDRVTTLGYDAANRAVVQLDALGSITRRVYDNNGNLIQTILHARQAAELARATADGAVPGRVQLLAAIVVDPAQDRSLRQFHDAANRLVYTVDALGFVARTDYDAAGRVVGTWRYAQPLPGPTVPNSLATLRAAVRTDAADRGERRVLDALGRTVHLIDGLGFVTSLQYDGLGRESARTRHAYAVQGLAQSGPLIAPAALRAGLRLDGQLDQTSTIEYDRAGRVLRMTDALGHADRFRYDALGRKISRTNARGDVWHMTYDAAGRLLSEQAPAVAVTKVVPTATGGLAVSGSARLLATLSLRRYDALGNLLELRDAVLPDEPASGHVSLYEYDAAGRQTRSRTPGVRIADPTVDPLLVAAAQTRPEHVVELDTETLYNSFGEAVAGRDAAGFWRFKVYDRLGRVSHEVDGDLALTSMSRNAFGEEISRRRYARTLAPAVRDALTSLTGVRRIDAMLSAVQAATGDPAEDRVTLTRRDRLGRVTEITEPASFIFDPSASGNKAYFVAGKKTRYTSNAFGEQVAAATLINAVDGRSALSRFEYDQRGQQIASIDALGYLSTMRFDAWGNRIEQRDYARALNAPVPDASGGGAASVAQTGPDDRLTAWRWDRANRLVGETRVAVEISEHDGVAGVLAPVRRRADLETVYELDALGNRLRVIDAAGGEVRTWYDALGRVRAQTGPARPVGLDGAPFNPLREFGRDAAGNAVVTIERARGAISAQLDAYVSTPDPTDRVTLALFDTRGLRVQSADAAGASEYFSWDAAGRLAGQWQDLNDEDGVRSTRFAVFERDAAGREIRALTPASTSVLRGGADGGRVERVSQSAAGVVERDSAYNAFGEKIATGIRGVADGEQHFEYDNAGVLWRSNGADGVERIFLHDLSGQRSAELRSSGSGGADLDFHALSSAAQAVAIGLYNGTDVRRTDFQRDLLGRITAQTLPARIEAPAQVQLRSAFVLASITPAAVVFDESGNASLSGENRVDLSWTSLASLGRGEVQLVLDYWTEAGGESGLPELRTRTETRAAALADAGMQLRWQESGALPGGITRIERVRVYKRDVQGAWQLLMERTPAAMGSEPQDSVLEVSKPADVSLHLSLQLRPAASAASADWTEAAEATLTDFGEALRFDGRGLPAGRFEYRLRSLDGLNHALLLASGMLETGPPGPNWRADFIASPAQTAAASPTSTAAVRPVIEQTFDRWGNLLSVSDPRAPYWLTTWRYNAANQVIAETLPDPGGRAGITSTGRQWYYDRLGRQIALRDAKGQVMAWSIDAAGNRISEHHADGGVVRWLFDGFGQEQRQVDAMGHRTDFVRDGLGRLTGVIHESVAVSTMSSDGRRLDAGVQRLVEQRSYDQAGRLLSSTNGNGETLHYQYDLRDQIIARRQPLGQTVRMAFDPAGRKIGETDANGYTASWVLDGFGQILAHTDLGGAVFVYRYDRARQRVAEASSRGQNRVYRYDAAGQVLELEDRAQHQVSSWAYDRAGRHVRETTVQDGSVFQDNHLAYDALGRLRDVADGRLHLGIEYDANGNRNVLRSTRTGAPESARWFAYDSMDRQILVDGLSAAGAIGPGQGHRLAYDLNGNRIRDTAWGERVTRSGGETVVAYSDESGQPVFERIPLVVDAQAGEVTETYLYDALNRLSSVRRDQWLVDRRYYDAAGRLLQSGPDGGFEPEVASHLGGSGLGSTTRLNRFDANGRLLGQRLFKSDGTPLAAIDNERYDAAGNLLAWRHTDQDPDSGNAGTSASYQSSWSRFDDDRESRVEVTGAAGQRGVTTRRYDVNGTLVAVTDSTLHSNDRSMINDASGRLLQVGQGGRVTRLLVVNGETLGSEELASAAAARLNLSWQAVTPALAAAMPGRHLVLPGETLLSIAQARYGDSQLWTRIAEANGLFTPDGLRAGQTLSLPALITGQHNGAGVFLPFDAAHYIGDTTPALPAPASQGGSGCGGLGAVLMTVVAIAVTVVLQQYTLTPALFAGPGAATAEAGFAAQFASGASSAALGSLASQGAGVLTGARNAISWRAVGGAAIGGGVSAGLGAVLPGPGSADWPDSLAGIGNVAARAALGNAAGQGLAVLTGLQDQFNLPGLAASGLSAGAGALTGNLLTAPSAETGLPLVSELFTAPPMAAVAVQTLAGMSGAAVGVLARGGRLSLERIATDAVGNVLGSGLAHALMNDRGVDATGVPEDSTAGTPLELPTMTEVLASPELTLPAGFGYSPAELYAIGLEARGVFDKTPSFELLAASTVLPVAQLPYEIHGPIEASFDRAVAEAGDAELGWGTRIINAVGVAALAAPRLVESVATQVLMVPALATRAGEAMARASLSSEGAEQVESWLGVVRDLSFAAVGLGGVVPIGTISGAASRLGEAGLNAASGLRALPGQAGHAGAARILPGGTGTALTGHGGKFSGQHSFIVPEGTAITLPRPDISILDRTGQFIEKGDWAGLAALGRVNPRVALDLEGMTTWLPGTRVPGYTLFPPDRVINLYSASQSVARPTLLKNILEPGMGCVQWAACTQFIRGKSP